MRLLNKQVSGRMWRMEITLKAPLDMHLHLRDGDMLRLTAPLSAAHFAGAVVMPNLVPPVKDLASLSSYAERVQIATDGVTKNHEFACYMTLFFRAYSATELETVRAQRNFFGIKLYPAGITTNSAEGLVDWTAAEPILKCMEELGIPLLVHGESHGFVMDRESEFLPTYRRLAESYPKLSICMEHITTAGAVKLLGEYENLCATITLHHLLLTLDDVIGGSMRPHLFCKPIAKRAEDRDALLEAALRGNPRVMFGSDSAPHPRHAKECCGCAAGVFTAPIALPCLATLFARHGALDHLQEFVSGNACRRYGLTPPAREVVLRDEPMCVPASYRGYGQTVVPMYAGEEIPWRVVKNW